MFDEEEYLKLREEAEKYDSYITTIDNPYSPIDDFTRWWIFDISHGYNSCAYLARLAKTSSELPEIENKLEVLKAINSILKWDEQKVWKKLSVPSENSVWA